MCFNRSRKVNGKDCLGEEHTLAMRLLLFLFCSPLFSDTGI